MAESSDAVQEAEETKKKVVLEEKSKEDLIKIVKKQLTLLQKAKGKTEELSRKCVTIEEEKNQAMEKKESIIIDLQQQLETLELKICNLTETKDKISEEKNNAITKLNDKIKSLEAEKNGYFASLSEKEEQIQCLSMQMATVKETCHCLQNELSNLQKINNDLKEEITTLLEARNTAVESLKAKNMALDFKTREWSELTDENNELKEKYGICIEENCLLTSKIQNLETEIKNLRQTNAELLSKTENIEVNDFSILINDNQKLQEEVNHLRDKCNNLKESCSPIESKITSSNELQEQKISEIRKENFELQQHLCNIESMNSKLKQKQNSLEEEIQNLSEKVQLLEADKQKQSFELESILKEKIELKEEIGRLMSSLQEFTEFKTGYEYALLHGAAAESFTELSAVENTQNVDSKEIVNSIPELAKNISSDKTDTFSGRAIEFDEAESESGFEFGILSGGDINEIYKNTEAESPNRVMPSYSDDHLVSDIYVIDEKSVINEDQIPGKAELVSLYEQLKLEKDHLKEEIKNLKARIAEYSSALEETLSDNESLKLSLEKCQKEHSSASLKEATHFTEETSEMTEKLPPSGKEFEAIVCNLENQILSLNKRIEFLETEKSEYCERNSSLMNELESSNTTIESFGKMLRDLEIQNKNIILHSDTLEKQNFEVSEKLRKKCEELDEFNSQLELLITKIKEVLHHKCSINSPSRRKAEKQKLENIYLIKILLEDLIKANDNNSLKIKNLEDTLNDILIKKHAVEEELLQIKELNQFLEDEARELRNEVEQMKIDRNSLLEPIDDNYCRDQCLRSPNELYSIEEIDDDLLVDPVSPETSESTVQQHCTDTELTMQNVKLNSENSTGTYTKIDISVQVNILDDKNIDNTLLSKNEELDDKFSSEVSQKLKSACSCKSIIEQMEIENSSLKDSLNAKSALVERIHSELDAQLGKVEELTEESEMKDKDIIHYQTLSKMLQEELNELKKVFITTSSFMKHMKNALNELQNDNTKLKYDISSLNTSSDDTVSTIRNYLSTTVYEYEKQMKGFSDKCTHMNEVFHYLMLQLDKISEDFGLWLNILISANNMGENIISFPPPDVDINLLKRTYQNLDVNDLFKDKCNSDCCSVINNFKKFEVVKQELLSIMHNNFFMSYQSILNELNEYKNSIVPNLESTAKNLEDKLKASKKDVKEEVLLEQKVEKEDEESSVEDLKKQLADTEIKMTKCKQIALKLKKDLQESKKQINEMKLEKEKYVAELAETQKELQKMSSEQFHYVQNYQSLQNEYDKTQDELEIQKENAKKLEIDLSSTLLELNSLKEKVADMDSQLLKANHNLEIVESTKQEKEKLIAELESKLIILESKKQEEIHKIEELEVGLKVKIEQINNLVEENNNLKAQLQSSQKDENKKNLLHLEMADYERSILELNNKIEKKDDEISDLKQKLSCEIEKRHGLLEEIESTEKLKETEQKRADSLKEVLDKTKSELAVTKERETELLTKVSHLQMQLEIVIQQEEHCKLQLSETSAEIQHLKEMLKTSSENHQRIIHTLESKISAQKQEILCAHKEVESIKQEFENYKIRVHSVLKQQKSTAPIIPIEENDKEKLESMVDKLKMQVKQLSEKLAAVSMEYEALQEEHDSLLQKYNKAIEEREKKDSEWHTKLEQLNAEKNKLRAAQEELSSQHLLQNEMLVSTYKKQIRIMSDEHKRTVNELQKQLESADLEIARLQRDQQKFHGLPLTPIVQDNPVSFDILSQERQEGEGSESIDGTDTPIRHLSLATIPTSGFLPFEKLLQSPHDELSTSASFISNQDSEKLLTDLNAANKKIEHLSEVLNESESTNLRLSEQVRVLKEEVRRLERNKEREQHAENLEYLKNVFIKFATLSPCSEKAMLIPVLTTMLKLSPAEQQQLKSISGDIDSNEPSGSGWGSYLHRWSGLA
ncbi:GRIP and coiled-coil domain-containing protein 2-like [Argiope bruennichi]|uniref:GRIP and coiled-coil domain-containing protein 2-like n=1 Tax=Argiope bruennichi TaxID=94029 RepID=UPI002495111F|nr:GRIP and coiled-coil domain-containing protein 2-like [Argiope bruennichi]XP_055941508.1 GRIP and coiled-coil domain-containing protein 2-like [Argiope bruennichi]